MCRCFPSLDECTKLFGTQPTTFSDGPHSNGEALALGVHASRQSPLRKSLSSPLLVNVSFWPLADMTKRAAADGTLTRSPHWRLTSWSRFDYWSGAAWRWWWCVRRTQCRVIVRLGDRWHRRIGRFRFERSGVKCCSKKPDRNLLTHRRPLRQASSRMAALKRGEGKTKGVTSGIFALVEIASPVLRQTDIGWLQQVARKTTPTLLGCAPLTPSVLG